MGGTGPAERAVTLSRPFLSRKRAANYSPWHETWNCALPRGSSDSRRPNLRAMVGTSQGSCMNEVEILTMSNCLPTTRTSLETSARDSNHVYLHSGLINRLEHSRRVCWWQHYADRTVWFLYRADERCNWRFHLPPSSPTPAEQLWPLEPVAPSTAISRPRQPAHSPRPSPSPTALLAHRRQSLCPAQANRRDPAA